MKVKLKIPDCLKHYPRSYYGNKATLINHIFALIPKNTKTLIDLFGGAMCVGVAAKRMLGVKVITNDILRFSALKGRVYISNNVTLLTDADLEMLITPNSKRGNSARKLYGHIFGKKNSDFIDNWTANIQKLSDPIKKDIAVFLPIICISQRFRFAATHFSANGMPTGNGQIWEVDLKADIFHFAKEVLPDFIYDNGNKHEVYNEDSLGLLNKVTGDVLYVDSPYVAIGRGGAYENHYAYFDDLYRVLTDRASEIKNRYDEKCELPSYADFTSRGSSLMGFSEIFKRANNIPLIIISYNTSSYIAIEEIESIAKTYGRTVATQYIDYKRPATIKGRNRDTHEVLIVCSNDPNHKPTFYKPEAEIVSSKAGKKAKAVSDLQERPLNKVERFAKEKTGIREANREGVGFMRTKINEREITLN